MKLSQDRKADIGSIKLDSHISELIIEPVSESTEIYEIEDWHEVEIKKIHKKDEHLELDLKELDLEIDEISGT